MKTIGGTLNASALHTLTAIDDRKQASVHYTDIGNASPDIPHGDVRAANDDIDRAICYLVGQGHNCEDLKQRLCVIVDRWAARR
jgi:hypothetical protein